LKYKMGITKDNYTEKIKKWLEIFLIKKYSKNYKVEVIIPKCNISKIGNNSLKKVTNYSLLDFSTDILGILTSKKDNEVKLVLANRGLSPISVKEIGEMNIYSQIINPEVAFILSLKGLPNEVNSLLLNENICSSLLQYYDKEIIILKINENGKVDPKCIFPRKFKSYF